MKPLVIYHSPCLDGFTAAWAMWLKYPDAEFIPGVYGQAPPDCTDRDVYLLDFSYKRDVLKAIARVARKVIVLDHHTSAEKELSNLWDADGTFVNTTAIFDMHKSGARLAWEWFHPSTEVPLLVRLVEDRDLWRFAVPNSKALNAVFFSYDYAFDTWSELADAVADHRYSALVRAGESIERKHIKDVKELVGKLQHLRDFFTVAGSGLPSTDIPCANLPYTLASDAANLMAKDAPFAATYFQDGDGVFTFSLRSVEGGVDVSLIAALYGGGGHKHAAGFRVASLEEL
jgi:oligoribonuclease NrnB/cAMP/cGMP phosphodiesterase (DHH superfamily)